ncbi:MAG: glycoside hydrolase family 27 protein [Ruminococcaceae bacterium]|nr:glycoside hydrolase family 27 protein [Oscillospiraceae bacterium]
MLAQTPPMGWNSWNTFGSRIDEKLLRDTADAICDLGLKEAGYEYVVIDDCWALEDRDENGRMVADPEKFPSGMKALADYIHSKGLKFGIYSCAGVRTCAGYPGSFDYEFIDAQTFADWGVDYLKYDFCFKPWLSDGPMLYNRMAMALKSTGREILFSACNWGSDEVEKWIRSAGAHIYRSTGDISDNFQSFVDIAKSQFDKMAYSLPGCFNDLDMLIVGMRGAGNVGNGGCTDAEYRMHFALWCLFHSPLMIGADLSKLNETDLALLKNEELLSIARDPEARTPMLYQEHPDYQEIRPIFLKHLANGEYIIAFFNFNDRLYRPGMNLYDIGIPVTAGYGFEGYEIFSGETLEWTDTTVFAEVPSHDCRIFRVKLTKKK